MTEAYADEFRGTERFFVERRIGSGGMGVVYRAYDRERGQRIAIKTLHRVEATAIYRLKREFRALADLVHPNLVRLYELFSDAEHWFFTMEYVEGTDFLDFVRSGSPARDFRADAYTPNEHTPGAGDSTERLDTSIESPRQKLDTFNTRRSGPPFPSLPDEFSRQSEIETPATISPSELSRLRPALRQLVEGIAAVHRADRLHRDVKPSNMLVTPQGRVVLLDFGLATPLGQDGRTETMSLNLVGTVRYMSPEQAAGLELSAASDWYSVGVMLYEALTGRPPFEGRPLQILRNKQEQESVPPCELVDAVPEDLNSLCTALLRRDPLARPSGDELAKHLGSASDGQQTLHVSPQPASPRAPFIGRKEHLDALADALRSVQNGQTTATYIRGNSGVGKSALVERFLDEFCTGDQTVVLAGRCWERESVPYKALDSLVDALSRYLVRLPRLQAEALLPREVDALSRVFPVLRRVDAVAEARGPKADIPDKQELRQRAFGALRELLARLGDRKTLVLHIDDLQWGDLDSVALLSDLLCPPDPPTLLLLVCYRREDEAASPVLQALLEPRSAGQAQIEPEQISVDPLTEEEARRLARELIGTDRTGSEELCDAIARESAGNPYFVDALVREQRSGTSPIRDLRATGTISLDQMLWKQASTMPATAMRLLQAVAVAGHPLRQIDAYEAAELATDDRETLAVLRTAHMIRTRGDNLDDEIETFHDRVRETVLRHLPPDAAADCHRSLAVVLDAAGGTDPAVLAAHFIGAHEPEQAAKHFVTAASQATDALAFDRAAELYRQAIELQPPGETDSQRLRPKLAETLANAGRGTEAAEQYLLAADKADATDAAEFRRHAAMQYLRSGHMDEGLALLHEVLAAVGMRLPKTPRRAIWSLIARRAMIRLRGLKFHQRNASQVSASECNRIDICWSAATGLTTADPIRAADFQARTLLLALRYGEPSRIARSLSLEAFHVATAGGVTARRVEQMLAKAEALARQVDDPHSIGLATLMAGCAAYLQGRWKDAVRLCDEAEIVFRDKCTGVAWELETAHGFAIRALGMSGQITELRRRLPTLLAEARRRGSLYALTSPGTFLLPALAADDPDTADKELQERVSQWSRAAFHLQHINGIVIQANIDIYRGRPVAAWRHVVEHWPAFVRSHLRRIQLVRVMGHEVRARCALAAAANVADSSAMLHTAKKDARRLQREGVPYAEPIAQMIYAGIAAHSGNTDQAATLLNKAIAGFDATDMSLYAAAARHRLGRLLGVDEGSDLIKQSDAWMAAQGIQNPARMTALFTPGF